MCEHPDISLDISQDYLLDGASRETVYLCIISRAQGSLDQYALAGCSLPNRLAPRSWPSRTEHDTHSFRRHVVLRKCFSLLRSYILRCGGNAVCSRRDEAVRFLVPATQRSGTSPHTWGHASVIPPTNLICSVYAHEAAYICIRARRSADAQGKFAHALSRQRSLRMNAPVSSARPIELNLTWIFLPFRYPPGDSAAQAVEDCCRVVLSSLGLRAAGKDCAEDA
jgi:hypothetical protein